MTAPTDVPDDEERHGRPFTEWLLKQGHGKLAAELTDKLDQLVQAVHITGKAGTLTFQVTLKPLEKGNSDVLTASDKVALKLPVQDRPASLFFVTAEGHLSQNDPKQMVLDLHEVPSTPKTLSELKDAK